MTNSTDIVYFNSISQIILSKVHLWPVHFFVEMIHDSEFRYTIG